jgi:hydrogenase maturation protease
MTPDGPLVVLGIGNLLLGDDGLGPIVVRELVRDGPLDAVAGTPAGLPPGTDLVDGGTTGLALLPTVAGARALVVVDAVDIGGHPPGTVHVLTGPRIGDAYRPRLTAHQVGAGDLIGTARLSGTLPERVALVGVQPESLGLGVGLGPAVTAALPQAVATVRSWCWRLHGAATEEAETAAGGRRAAVGES